MWRIFQESTYDQNDIRWQGKLTLSKYKEKDYLKKILKCCPYEKGQVSWYFKSESSPKLSRESLPFYFCKTTLKPDSEKKEISHLAFLNWK